MVTRGVGEAVSHDVQRVWLAVLPVDDDLRVLPARHGTCEANKVVPHNRDDCRSNGVPTSVRQSDLTRTAGYGRCARRGIYNRELTGSGIDCRLHHTVLRHVRVGVDNRDDQRIRTLGNRVHHGVWGFAVPFDHRGVEVGARSDEHSTGSATVQTAWRGGLSGETRVHVGQVDLSRGPTGLSVCAPVLDAYHNHSEQRERCQSGK